MISQAAAKFPRCESQLCFPRAMGHKMGVFKRERLRFPCKTFELTKFRFSDQSLSCF